MSDAVHPVPEGFEARIGPGELHALNAVAANVSFVEVKTDKGHDAFLLDEPEFHQVVRGFMDGCAEHRGLTRHRLETA